ncbi:hypothetical protein DTO166G4_2052 [Paecilomyces variotii]|nr:hypothetical protein DTO166G4_2052 [Paecilomyces variotii]KAJ9224888.1 hypothetical protein DTO169C6_2808 [Paecilomyces variotii]KAJ9230016.1 hypothetical protein DTO166G5_7514 [Paecilomyces variotii]KAJ9289390.1 hypothetical protein DTO021C3_2841 [Paecilomyces variotii]KAJ9401871.1 hypothetical protein DTO282F9_1161 [Paecilomyces variotii]
MKIQKPGSEALGTRTLSRILPDTEHRAAPGWYCMGRIGIAEESYRVIPAKEHRNKLCMGVRALRIALFGSRKTASFAEPDLGRRPGA